MPDDLVLIDASDPHITVLTLNRADKRNALSIALIEAIRAGIAQANGDLNRRVIIFKGNGPAFCAGLDLKEASDPTLAHKSAETLAGMYEAIATSPLVTIAAAHGTAMGGGAGFIAACDLAIAGDDLKLAYPEVHRGLVAALVTTLLRRQLGDRVVRELTIVGQTLDAKNAQKLGLVNRVAPAGALLQSAMDLAKQVCKGAPGAIARTKVLLDDLCPRTVREELDRALKFHLHARNSEEAKEGVAAFMEKREPKWGPRPK